MAVAWKLSLISFVTLMLAGMSDPLEAQANRGRAVTVYGVGSKSCGSWLEARESTRILTRTDVESSAEAQLKAWLDGYLTAYSIQMAAASPTRGVSQTEPPQAVQTDGPGMWAFIDKYCAEHPTADFFNVTIALIADQKPRNQF